MESLPIRTACIGDRSWRMRSEVINRAEVCEWLEAQSPNIVIATDGSIREGITAWAGVIWKDRDVCFQWSTARDGQSSSFRAESEAISLVRYVIFANLLVKIDFIVFLA